MRDGPWSLMHCCENLEYGGGGESVGRTRDAKRQRVQLQFLTHTMNYLPRRAVLLTIDSYCYLLCDNMAEATVDNQK